MIFRVDHLGQFRFDVGFSEPGQGLGQAARLPDVVAWDPSLLTQPDHPVLFQRGCPADYFSEFVAPGTSGAKPYPLSMIGGDPNQLSQGTWVRCRLMATTTPETLAAETGLSPSETLQVFTGAAEDTIEQIPERVRRAVEVAFDFSKWAVVGLATVAALIWLPRPRSR